MTIQNFKQRVSEVLNAPGLSAEIYFLLKSDAGYSLKSADIDLSAQQELKDQFVESVREKLADNDDLSLLNISEADERKNVIYKYDLQDLPPKLSYLEQVANSDQFESFNFNSDSLESIEAVLIILGNEQSQIVLYKHQYPIYLVKKKEFSLVRVGQGSRLGKFNADVLKINPNFEFLYVDGHYYIAELKLLERSYGFSEAIMQAATEGLTRIEEALLVEDITHLTDRLNELSFSKKLLRATRGSKVLGNIPTSRIIEFAINHPKLGKKFKVNADGTKFDLRTKVSHKFFLKLLDDAILHSQLTEQDYDSLAKDELTEAAAD